jgi:hypothetical protein
MSYIANRFEQSSQVGSFQWKKDREGNLEVNFTPQDPDRISPADLDAARELSYEMGQDLNRFKNAATNLKKADAGPDTPPAAYGRPYLDEDRKSGQVSVRRVPGADFEERPSSMDFSGTMKFSPTPKASPLEKAFAVGGVEELQYTVVSRPFDGNYSESRTLLSHSPEELLIGCGAANEYTSVMSGSLGEAYTYRVGPKGQISIEETY